jgi:hemerythrin
MLENHAWNEKLDVGHEAIDHDHHTQLALLAALTDAIEQRRPALARRLGEELAGYSRAHFRSEELLMEVKDYRDSPAHAAEHQKLLARIDEVSAAHAGGDDDLALSLALDFRTALAAHMNDADRRVAAFAAEGGRGR